MVDVAVSMVPSPAPGLVLDCSVTMSWLFADEADEATDALLHSVAEQGALVPSLWHLEVANVLLLAQRQGRISAAQITQCTTLLEQLPITVDAKTNGHGFREVLSCASTYMLSAYNASYLELAMRRALPLATTDEYLVRAAGKAGVLVLP